ncbi:MAG: hypothetical protein MJ102_07865 [Clostridia bacterium]|nr:hypothetical protein [Clostridia bacterium]
MSKLISFNKTYFRRIISFSLILSVTFVAMLMNYFGISMGREVYGEGAYLINFAVTLIYLCAWIIFLSFAGIKNDRVLMIFGRVWCILTLIVFVFTAVVITADISLGGIMAVIADVFVTLFVVPWYGGYLIFTSRLLLVIVSFVLVLGLCFIPEIAVRFQTRRMIKKQFEK